MAVVLAAACSDTPTNVADDQPPPIPDSLVDQVGLPADYATAFTPFYTLDRADNRQVRVVFANAKAANGPPFEHGSILVMETYSALRDAAGNPTVGADGRYQRGVLAGIFVMRKEEFFGRRYQEHQTGEWEYASFRPDKAP